MEIRPALLRLHKSITGLSLAKTLDAVLYMNTFDWICLLYYTCVSLLIPISFMYVLHLKYYFPSIKYKICRVI